MEQKGLSGNLTDMDKITEICYSHEQIVPRLNIFSKVSRSYEGLYITQWNVAYKADEKIIIDYFHNGKCVGKREYNLHDYAEKIGVWLQW